MKRRTLWFVGAAAAAGVLWSSWRNARYPVEKEYRIWNQYFVPGVFLTPGLASAGNRVIRRMGIPQPPEGIVRRTEWIPGEGGGRLRMTFYEPAGEKGPLPCLVYCHGGGFCFEGAWYIHRNVAEYARTAHCKVAFLHYRTSDRAPFPAPFQDCCAGLSYVWDNSVPLGIDRTRVALGGDSAGGALAAACCLWARDGGKIKVCFQMLIYPVTDAGMTSRSMKRYVDSPMWNRSLNRSMWRIYLRDGDHGKREYASPMCAKDFSRLPAAYVETEEYDCLHDEGVAFGEALRLAGCPVQLEDVRGTFHGFDVIGKARMTKRMLRIRGQALRRAFWGDFDLAAAPPGEREGRGMSGKRQGISV